MADLQNYFERFHENIRLTFDDNDLLRKRRDVVLRDLKAGLKKLFSPNKAPVFTYFNQGSYALGTGVAPVDGDYDIDVGIVFKLNKEDVSPLQIKSWVYEALNTKNRTVYFMRPCVRVQYHQNDYETFHIDLAVYTEEEDPKTGKRSFFLAKCLPKSGKDHIIWEESDPFELLHLLRKRFNDTDDNRQFRRVVRYLKRWNELNFNSEGHAKPRGIAITALAYRLFKPVKTYNSQDEKYYYNDLKATRNFVVSIINSFSFIFNNISITLPVKPHSDLFAKMTKNQKLDFKDKLKNLKEVIDSAIRSKNVENAYYDLTEEFGDDFFPSELYG